MRRNTVETILGGVVLVAAALFMMLAYEAANLTSADGYRLDAEFGSVSGLNVGDDVRLSGIKIGQIVGQGRHVLRLAQHVSQRVTIVCGRPRELMDQACLHVDVECQSNTGVDDGRVGLNDDATEAIPLRTIQCHGSLKSQVSREVGGVSTFEDADIPKSAFGRRKVPHDHILTTAERQAESSAGIDDLAVFNEAGCRTDEAVQVNP